MCSALPVIKTLETLPTHAASHMSIVSNIRKVAGASHSDMWHMAMLSAIESRLRSSRNMKVVGGRSCTVRRLVLVRHEHYTTTMPPHQTDDRMPEHDFGRLNVSLGWLVYNNNNHNSNTLVSALDHHSDFTEAHDIVTTAV